MLGAGVTAWHWRQAMQIAAQVPPEEADAWQVMRCVEQILKLSFSQPPDPSDPLMAGGDGQLLPFPGGSRKPKRRSTS